MSSVPFSDQEMREKSLTRRVDVRENNTHGASIEDTLNKPVTAFMGHANERTNASQESNMAKGRCLFQGEPCMFQVDEQRVKPGTLGKLDDVCVGGDFDAKRLAHLVKSGGRVEIIFVECHCV
jgi:hypothetical protein